MVKINKDKSLEEYGEIIRKLNPVLSDKLVLEIQDYIEHKVVEYSPEEIKEERFLDFVADNWASEIKIERLEENWNYSFSLYDEEQSVIDVLLILGVNEDETEIMVVDMEVAYR